MVASEQPNNVFRFPTSTNPSLARISRMPACRALVILLIPLQILADRPVLINRYRSRPISFSHIQSYLLTSSARVCRLRAAGILPKRGERPWLGRRLGSGLIDFARTPSAGLAP